MFQIQENDVPVQAVIYALLTISPVFQIQENDAPVQAVICPHHQQPADGEGAPVHFHDELQHQCGPPG